MHGAIFLWSFLQCYFTLDVDDILDAGATAENISIYLNLSPTCEGGIPEPVNFEPDL